MSENPKRIECDSVYIEITERCNLSCLHCYNKSGGKKDGYIPFSMIEELVLSFKQNGVQPVLSLSGGEPLCHPDIKRILNYMREQKYPFRIVTNGVLAEEYLLPIISEDPMSFQVQLSLDGATANTNDRIRGDGHFHKAVNFMRKSNSMGYKGLSARMTVSKINMHEVEEFIDICLENNVSPKFGFVSRLGSAFECWESVGLSDQERMDISQRVNMALKKRSSAWNKFENNPAYLRAYSAVCPHLKYNWVKGPAIKTNGDVQPCQALYDPEFAIGNIYRNNIISIISPDNPDVRLLRALLEERAQHMNKKYCSTCPISHTCKGGCPAMSFERNDICELDGDCQYRVNSWMLSNLSQLRTATERLP